MRLAIIRQRYSPGGAIESRLEAALAALLERNVAISLYTRSWDEPRLQLIETVLCNPGLLRSPLARVELRAHGRAGRSAAPRSTWSRRTTACAAATCIAPGTASMRAGSRSATRARRGSPSCASGLSPTHQYMLRAERRLFTSPWLQAVICPSRMVKDEIHDRFGVPAAKLHVIYNSVDTQVLHPGLRSERATVLERHRDPRRRDDLPARLHGLRAQRRRRCDRSAGRTACTRTPRHRRAGRHAERYKSWRGNSAWPTGSPSPIPSSTCGRTTAPPTSSCCRRSTTPRPIRRWRRWRAASRRDQHEIRRRRAPARARCGLRMPGGRRRGTRRADALAARRRKRASGSAPTRARRRCRSRLPRSRCSSSSSIATCSRQPSPRETKGKPGKLRQPRPPASFGAAVCSALHLPERRSTASAVTPKPGLPSRSQAPAWRARRTARRQHMPPATPRAGSAPAPGGEKR